MQNTHFSPAPSELVPFCVGVGGPPVAPDAGVAVPFVEAGGAGAEWRLAGVLAGWLLRAPLPAFWDLPSAGVLVVGVPVVPLGTEPLGPVINKVPSGKFHKLLKVSKISVLLLRSQLYLWSSPFLVRF